MSDVKRLLAEATPLPWESHGDGYVARSNRIGLVARAMGEDEYANAALIVYAVNHLPDYEAAVEALERLVDQFDNYDPAGTGYTGFSVEPARAAVRRLQEAVPA